MLVPLTPGRDGGSADGDGPITGGTHGFPFFSSAADLESIGYTEAEYFLESTATDYSPVEPLTSDGRWNVAPGPDTTPYKTRMLVRAPKKRHFNGTVVVEWINVSAGFDFAGWYFIQNELVRDGYAWVGVSAQREGVEGAGPFTLKNWDPARYGTLTHPGDSFSYDIFSQAGRAIADPRGVNPLAGLKARRLLAFGESQSAARLSTYYNAVHPLVDVFDGFMPLSRGSSTASLRQPPQAAVPAPAVVQYRTDKPTPLLLVQTETEYPSYAPARQPDSRYFGLWEVAGASHVDKTLLVRTAADATKSLGAPFSVSCTLPVNEGLELDWVLDRGLHSLNQWVRTGRSPARAPRFAIDAAGVIARDEPASPKAASGCRMWSSRG
jgi:hypothetical protein